MPTRPRTGSSRTKKTAAPLSSSDELQHSSSDETSAAAAPGEETVAAGAEVTAARLERRDIPSFSTSREARIAEAAYWRAERRGFAAGRELEDWLEAEREIDRDLQTEQVRQTKTGEL